MQLSGYIVRTNALVKLGSGDADAVEGLASAHEEELAAIDRRSALADGEAERALASWVMDGRGMGRAARSVLELLVTDAPRDRLHDDAWSPVKASTLEELDAALQKAGLARNASLGKLARPAHGAASRLLSIDDGQLRLLAGHGYHTVEKLWPAAIARLATDDAARANALLRWWETTLKRHVDASIRGQQLQFDLLLALV